MSIGLTNALNNYYEELTFLGEEISMIQSSPPVGGSGGSEPPLRAFISLQLRSLNLQSKRLNAAKLNDLTFISVVISVNYLLIGTCFKLLPDLSNYFYKSLNILIIYY